MLERLAECAEEKIVSELAAKVPTPDKPKNQRYTLHVETHSRAEFKDVTSQIEQLIERSGISSGQCHLFVPHTSAAILINENSDPGLRQDITDFLKTLAPPGANYHHDDGNCDSHLKATLIGVTRTLLIENHRLLLGRWQGIYFCEFDGPRRRDLYVKLVSD
ncbi:MAG: YjbQ family protein [Acidobacteria bacterium]|nr:MAG: YjbQ family protein [Acidobacteriota bacterium]